MSSVIALIRQAIAFFAGSIALLLSGTIAGLAALTQAVTMMAVGMQYLGGALQGRLKKNA